MRGLVSSPSRLSSILLVSLSMLSAHALWSQKKSTPEESVAPLPDAPSRAAKSSGAQAYLDLTYKGLPLSIHQNEGKTGSCMRFFPYHTGHDRLSLNTGDVLNHEMGATEFWSKNKYLLGSPLPRWLMLAPTFGHVSNETTNGGNDLEYYGHRIPWAGSTILRISQQAKAHPYITSVLKSIHPKF